jgi:hypothetical protein
MDRVVTDVGAGAPALGRTGRALALGIGVLGLLSLVALASQGPMLRARTHNRQGHMPGWTTEIFAAVVVLGGALFLYGVVAVRRNRPPRSTTSRGSGLIIVVLAFVVALVVHNHQGRPQATQKPPAVTPTAAASSSAPRPGRPPAGTGATWFEVLALAGAAVVALAAATRPRRVASGHGGSGDLLVALVDDSLEDLRAEPDPRRAVIAAYARMERGLRATGLARDPAETPLEYLGRVLAGRRVSPAAVTRLTSLFQHAKFSDRPVAPAAKQQAIAALEAVRDELRAGAGQVAATETDARVTR